MLKATDLDTLREELEVRGVQFLMASFSDMHGVSKTKLVPIAHLREHVFQV